jgi:hypothetical protein
MELIGMRQLGVALVSGQLVVAELEAGAGGFVDEMQFSTSEAPAGWHICGMGESLLGESLALEWSVAACQRALVAARGVAVNPRLRADGLL